MVDIMGSSGLAWHQWRKHGRCAGMPATEYFAQSRAAFGAIRLPDALQAPDTTLRLPPEALAQAFADALPGATAGSVAVMCRGAVIREVRVCLTPALEPRRCGADVADRACTRRTADLLPVR